MKRLALVLVTAALALGSAGCSTTGPPPAGQDVGALGPAADDSLDSIALIEHAVAAGRIDYSTGVLYKVYAMFDPASLPPEFASDVPAKCGTPLILEVQRNWQRLHPEHRAEIEVYIQPIADPQDAGTDLDDVTRDRLDHDQNRLD